MVNNMAVGNDILEAGEEYVFGPVISTKTTSMSGGAGASQGSVSRSTSRTVGVTNHRIIIKDEKAPQGSQNIQNSDVRKVFVKKRVKNNVTTMTLVKVETASGSVINVDLKGIPSAQEERFSEVFPEADFEEVKGGSKGIIIAAGIVAAVLFVCCIVVFGPLLFAK